MLTRLKGLLKSALNAETPSRDVAMKQCAEEFAQLVIGHLKDDKGVNIETAISAAGGVAGHLLLRATRVDLSSLPPGSAVFVDQVNEAGPGFVEFLSTTCAKEGINPRTGWTGEIPKENSSLVPVIDLVRDLYHPFIKLADKFGVPEELQPNVAGMAAIKLVRMGSQVLSPEIGKAITLWSVLSASKTVPHPAAG